MPRSVLLGAAATAAAIVAAAGAVAAVAAGRGGAPPVRVGVVADCVGFFRSHENLMLAGAEAPFLARGARPRSADPTGGVTDAKLPDGRRARLLIDCDEGGEFSTLIAAVRRLVEQQHADVVVAGTWPGDGIMLGRIARLYPHVAFVAASTGPVEVTAARPSSNLFRIRPSWAQQAAGLGVYAYHRLGWRRVAVLAEDDEEGWDEAAAFTAELCASGGTADRQLGFPLTVTQATTKLAPHIDGVAVFSAGVTDPAVVLPRLRAAFGARRLLVGIGVASDPRAARFLDGVLSPAIVPAPDRSLAQRLQEAFPTLPPAAATNSFVVDFNTSVEAVLEAAASPNNLGAALSRLELTVPPAGRLQVSSDGQATVPVTLVLHQGNGGGHTVAKLPSVPPLLGGLLSKTEPPTRAAPSCHRSVIPAYARSLLRRR